MVVAGSKIGIETWVGKAVFVAAVAAVVVVVAAAAAAAAAAADLDLHGNLHYLGMSVQVGPCCSLADSANSVQ
jgi:hypothetical protein